MTIQKIAQNASLCIVRPASGHHPQPGRHARSSVGKHGSGLRSEPSGRGTRCGINGWAVHTPEGSRARGDCQPSSRGPVQGRRWTIRDMHCEKCTVRGCRGRPHRSPLPDRTDPDEELYAGGTKSRADSGAIFRMAVFWGCPHVQERMPPITWPCTSVRRRSMPLLRVVSFVWSMPRSFITVACTSCTVVGWSRSSGL